MKGHSIIMRTEQTREHALSLIARLPVDYDKPLWHVVIKPYRKNRSVDQNNLLHMWFQEIANQTGNDLETVKEYLRGKFLSPVFKEWSDPFSGEITVLQYPRSTTTLDTKEMTTFLNQVEQFALENGIVLSNPADLMWSVR